ncbi:Plasmodium exported protein, unknown function [Plasmodium knowlesi strain H]|uniref:Uncharacterized protein n=3 Tax=Plasmodium knowlesi TaxID=5850 RepID=A0A1A7VLH5_PLAKH|nr:Plasmodium exported protein, unknown function [Plasmodium knowlesi strain H]OTN65418.1 Uncharacterized protein PKNOH_S110117900 [Plasmodium knowlesi]CAA9989795.1 Plasmodium exported protein, unknown function [Plasmodium knowlesi strain H]SBO22903.1 Plasmodium exported protein, unknown function [Plasmodium knowlesi strain H]SBO22995.1 Plasmodium exported protein, unknown function [Plasmodium knowlesi strain H]VVS79269.1 Plasmodium exported protein, unknown function [Plasmodium knowlesi strai
MQSQCGSYQIVGAGEERKMDEKKSTQRSSFFTKRTAMLFFVLACIFLKHQDDFSRQGVNAPLQVDNIVGRNLASKETEEATPPGKNESLKTLFGKKGKKEEEKKKSKKASGSECKEPTGAGNEVESAEGKKGDATIIFSKDRNTEDLLWSEHSVEEMCKELAKEQARKYRKKPTTSQVKAALGRKYNIILEKLLEQEVGKGRNTIRGVKK